MHFYIKTLFEIRCTCLPPKVFLPAARCVDLIICYANKTSHPRLLAYFAKQTQNAIRAFLAKNAECFGETEA